MDNPVINKYGTKHWYNKKDQLHRTDGPALEYPDGDKYWYQNGNLHRLDGPAVECADGYKQWYINGEELTEEEFNRQKPIELQPIINRFEALMDELNE